jgi:hypothetical protein
MAASAFSGIHQRRGHVGGFLAMCQQCVVARQGEEMQMDVGEASSVGQLGCPSHWGRPRNTAHLSGGYKCVLEAS